MDIKKERSGEGGWPRMLFAGMMVPTHRHLATSPHRHFERSRPTFSSPFASCLPRRFLRGEWVGLRREKSLFDRASSANPQTTAKERRAIYGTAVDTQAVLANAILRFQRLESREGAREAGLHARQSVEEQTGWAARPIHRSKFGKGFFEPKDLVVRLSGIFFQI